MPEFRFDQGLQLAARVPSSECCLPVPIGGYFLQTGKIVLEDTAAQLLEVVQVQEAELGEERVP